MRTGRHTLYNLGGAGASLAIMLVTVPLYMRAVGEARYGILAIVWLLLGYFSVFDLGLGRACAQAIAASDPDRADHRNDIVWSALLANAGFGGIGGGALFLAAGLVLPNVMARNGALLGEVMVVLPWLAAAVPIATTTAVFNGVLLGRGRFLEMNLLVVAGSALFQILPVVVAGRVGPQLEYVIPAAIVARILGVIPIVIVSARVLPIGRPRRACLAELPRLLRFGLWVSGASLVAPLLASADRMIIGLLAGPSAVSHYVVPLSIADRLNVLPRSLAQSLFPELAADRDDAQTKRRVRNIVLGLSALLAPASCAAIALLPAFLALWIGPAFAAQSSLTGQILFVGVWLNVAAIVPHTMLHAIGRPDLPLKFYLIEIGPYLLLLWLGLSFGGIAGAAGAWSLRTGADMVLMIVGTGLGWSTVWRLLPHFGLLSLALLAGQFAPDPALRAIVQTGIVAVSLALAWHRFPLDFWRGRLGWRVKRTQSPDGQIGEIA
ncbi:oligosaccharide flippase family protein [Jiella sp. MQZ9-1]|uniref:Oligosaccharide flippase family protein n=1 Tax=Jiella flava TaxID=2816857 RepID=A0A939FV05_9HYPH|nr:oligosaccharide flippase family protein [Jiella flava]MCD2471678.1 oligosaccharide flippase family protein [Jiella flava]